MINFKQNNIGPITMKFSTITKETCLNVLTVILTTNTICMMLRLGFMNAPLIVLKYLSFSIALKLLMSQINLLRQSSVKFISVFLLYLNLYLSKVFMILYGKLSAAKDL